MQLPMQRLYKYRNIIAEPPITTSQGTMQNNIIYREKIITSTKWSRTLLLPLVSLLLSAAVGVHANNNGSGSNEDHYSKQEHQHFPIDSLDNSSVVLITGIAGFIGAELAIALHRVYSPKKIIGIDSMDDGFGLDHNRSAEELGVFDFKRQRLFHIFQTLKETCHFYRVDFRPNIPDYQDRGEVPVLRHVFAEHPDVTHVVHLADPYGAPLLLVDGPDEVVLTTQAVPRKKEQIKSGMMEAILEQLLKAGKLHPQGRIPHFTYASSSHVYNHFDTGHDAPNPPPFLEGKPITTPSSIHGASKLLDEILAKTYHDTQGIYSVGLRMFDVYGPWGSPGSMFFDLSERAVRGGDFLSEVEECLLDTSIRDFIYVDDAVDALMAAMQFRPIIDEHYNQQMSTVSTPPVVINVGTGEGSTIRTIAHLLKKYLLNTVSSKIPPPNDSCLEKRRSISYASTSRAKDLLGVEFKVSLEEGLLNLLSWHHDRAFPYGSVHQHNPSLPHHPLEFQGIVACSPLDAECLKGAPVFPCASECSHGNQCTPSFYDSTLETTRLWTKHCKAVLFTVNLDNELTRIPSATAEVSTTSHSHVVHDEGHCNLAFVSTTSLLVKSLQENSAAADSGIPLKHGFWTLVLVNVNEAEKLDFFLEFLPKVSPGLFFPETKWIVYCEPNVIIDSIPNLLAEVAKQPLYQSNSEAGQTVDKKRTTEGKEGATAMLIGKGRKSQYFRKGRGSLQDAVQAASYRSVRISVIDEIPGEGFAQSLDTSFLVHTLQSEDSRLFRCDIFGELLQWQVGTDQSAFEFVMELHDMWSSVIVKKAGLSPWWVDDEVVTIPEQNTLLENHIRGVSTRRLEESIQGQTDNANSKVRSLEAYKAAGIKRDANFGDGDDRLSGGRSSHDGVEAIGSRSNQDKEDDGIACLLYTSDAADE